MPMSNSNCPNKHKIKFSMQVPSEVSESRASTYIESTANLGMLS